MNLRAYSLRLRPALPQQPTATITFPPSSVSRDPEDHTPLALPMESTVNGGFITELTSTLVVMAGINA